MFRSSSQVSISIAALLTLLIGVTLTVLMFAAARRYEYHKTTAEFQLRAHVRLAAIVEGTTNAIDGLRSVNRLFATVGPVTREQFRMFTQPVLARAPYIQAFTFERLVPASELGVFETGMRRKFPDFAVTSLHDEQPVSAAARDKHRVIEYIEPFAPNRRLLGFDAASDLYQDDAANRARDSGTPAASGLYPLQGRPAAQRGIVILMPVYRQGAAIDDLAARRSATIGYTAAVFSAEGMIKQILTAGGFLDEYNVDIDVYAGHERDKDDLDGKAGEGKLAFRHRSAAAVHTITTAVPEWLLYNHPAAISDTFDVAGQTWRIGDGSQLRRQRPVKSLRFLQGSFSL